MGDLIPQRGLRSVPVGRYPTRGVYPELVEGLENDVSVRLRRKINPSHLREAYPQGAPKGEALSTSHFISGNRSFAQEMAGEESSPLGDCVAARRAEGVSLPYLLTFDEISIFMEKHSDGGTLAGLEFFEQNINH